MNADTPAPNAAQLFEKLLGRLPDPAELAGLPADEPALITRLTDLVEYRNRFRDALRTDANALASASLWPARSRDYDLQVMLISAEGLSKCAATIARIQPHLRPRTLLTIVCGDPEDGRQPEGEHIELVVMPGASVFDIRARLPTLLRESAWVALCEDHAVPDAGWVDGVLAAIAEAAPDQLAFTATVTNQHSTSPWSWASFLFNFAYHWHPSAASALPGTVTSLVFRRDLLGSLPLKIHEFEQFILGRVGPAYNSIRVDHDQPLSWWRASTHTLDNGIVTGSALRRHRESPRRAMRDMVGWVNGGRVAEIARVLATHPYAATLLPGTIGRLRWIGLCHSAGVVWGCIFGGGRAHKRLE